MRILVEGIEYDSHDSNFQTVLARCHKEGLRLTCQCRSDQPQELCVASLGTHYYARRMPNTADQHDSECELYSAPLQLAQTERLSEAISIDEASGEVTVRAGFAMQKRVDPEIKPQRPINRGLGDMESTDVRTIQSLTLSAMLKLIWQQARLNYWYPKMEAKRSWSLVRFCVLEQMDFLRVRERPFKESVFVPREANDHGTPVNVAQFNEFKTGLLRGQNGKKANLGFVLDIVETLTADPGGEGAFAHCRNLPEPIYLPLKNIRTVVGALARCEDLDPTGSAQCLVLASVYQTDPAMPVTTHQIAAMTVDEFWLPFQTGAEFFISQLAVSTKRSFVRDLELKACPEAPPLITMLDTFEPMPVYLASESEDNDAIPENGWVWTPPSGPLPGSRTDYLEYKRGRRTTAS